ncbi:MAG: DNA polymerase/3'-5' exonuclease PolX [Trueperaceae bacterium]|nr:DNA polymerase/3'-5' exonuclease PolX [Trueperaceae bacterium]
MENAQLADLFDEIADLIELKDGNEFRIRAYRAAAGTIRGWPDRLEDLVERGEDLSEIPDIGEGSAEKIHEILETGTTKRLEALRDEVPTELTELLRVQGLGPKTAMQIHEELGVNSLSDLKQACEDQRVRELDGLGEKTEQTILEGIEALGSGEERMLLGEAQDHVTSIGRHLDGIDAIDRWEVAGSYRRRKETVGDLDILVSTSDREATSDAIEAFRDVDEVLGRGAEGLSVRLGGGLQVDVRYFGEAEFGSALVYFTGSKEHNIELRRLAVDRDWKLNEYGLFKGDHRLAGHDEEAVYHRLNLAWVPPEMRENRGEIDAAGLGELPDLIRADQLRGDLHTHTDATDGAGTLSEMIQAAADRGYAYYAVTDHSKRVTMANGLDDDAALKHADAIREAGEEHDDLWVLAGIEVDILKDGSLDLKEATLAQLDWVVASIHYDLDLDEEAMTSRLLAAVRSGVVHCIGHPTTRRLGKRGPIPFDADRVFEACARHDVALEINAQPQRLDLPDVYCKRAKEAGVRFTISTDAHKRSDLSFLRFGVDVARRGWLERGDVLNTGTAAQLRKRLGKD